MLTEIQKQAYRRAIRTINEDIEETEIGIEKNEGQILEAEEQIARAQRRIALANDAREARQDLLRSLKRERREFEASLHEDLHGREILGSVSWQERPGEDGPEISNVTVS